MVMERLQQRERGRGGTWGEWSAWTPCSRSCGGGVSIQSRECLATSRRSRVRTKRTTSSNHNRGSNRCVGLYRRFQLCNTQACGPGYVDFRREQCSSFNKTPFNRRFYTWEPYYDTPDSCALNCRAVGLSFYATLNRTVIDGTHCGLPDANRICVAGRCLALGCDGVLGSGVQLDSCGVCGGDNTSCRVIAGVFSHPKMPYGYNMIATLPRGAANITIQHVKPSTNYLALRHPGGEFFMNGNWAANVSGYYHSSGTAFAYQRADPYAGDKVTAMGPLLQPVDVMLFYQSLNPGIKYEYRLPMAHGASPRLSSVVPVTAARRTAADNPLNPLVPGGPASRTPPSGPVNDARSFNGNSIQSSQWWKEQQEEEKKKKKKERRGKKGNRRGKNGVKARRKKYEWKVVGFSSCSETCGGGSQTTRVACVKRKRGNEVPTNFCQNLPRPAEETVRCNLRPCPPTWVPEEWGPCSVTCGLGVQTRALTCQMRLSPDQYVEQPEGACLSPSPMAHARVCELPACDAAPAWVAEEWGACSAQCGLGTRHREVTCKTAQGPVADELCEARNKPSNQELCDMGSCATDTWFFSAWEDTCSEDCGEGVQRRRVHCSGDALDNQVTETSCDPDQRPDTTRPCTSDRGCGGKWFTGPWGECNAQCGEGRRSRAVVCVVFRGRWRVTTDLTQCKGHPRPDSSEACTRACSQQWYTSEWSQCSASCASGVQRREVKCLNEELEPALGCTAATKPDTRQPCNTQPCHQNESLTASSQLDPNEAEQADESVANASKSEAPQQSQVSSSDGTSVDQQPSGNVGEAGWRPPPESLETTNSMEAEKRLGKEESKDPVQDIQTAEREKEKDIADSTHSPSKRREQQPIRPGRPWRPGLSTGSCMDRMKNCHLVFKARLCRLKYYNKLCCETCSKNE
ncbi:thrombospondin type-1 domain-containing protein 4-like isoform X1 [Eriocheir sinensis]|uniref:thrombospondin type-1 domain-containing protein 4-like isoform X1 n=1 Tax=Eriocheir sinensis TaxID=95602 RepID=UPI0021C74D4F|nr:thrombospondin type-1 domain-containing protein 4-like isoform X1 [Eriocheir sinensis]